MRELADGRLLARADSELLVDSLAVGVDRHNPGDRLAVIRAGCRDHECVALCRAFRDQLGGLGEVAPAVREQLQPGCAGRGDAERVVGPRDVQAGFARTRGLARETESCALEDGRIG